MTIIRQFSFQLIGDFFLVAPVTAIAMAFWPYRAARSSALTGNWFSSSIASVIMPAPTVLNFDQKKPVSI